MSKSDKASHHVTPTFLIAIGAGAVLGSAVTQWWFRRSQQERNRGSSTTTRNTIKRQLPQSIRSEQLSRHELYFGIDGMEKLRQARICVVGLGGVGSHTVSALARSGIGFLRIIDFDQVSLSSLNRHAHATLADVGTPKALCLQKYCEQICPDPMHLQVEARVEMYTAETAASLLDDEQESSSWDLVIDAIDDVPTKAQLIQHCLKRKIRVVSCMGAGGKSDFTRLCISDLRSASKDPLATKLKQILKRGMKDNNTDYLDDIEALTVLYTSEKPVVKLADMTESQQAQGIHNFGAVEGMRIRILPVLGTMPAIMGQALAAFALTECGGQPIKQPVSGERLGKNVRNKFYQHLLNRESRIREQFLSDGETIDNPSGEYRMNGQIWLGHLQVDADDLDYIMQTWRNRCAVTGSRLGTVFHIVRWDISRPSAIDNLVLMSQGALQKYDVPSNYRESFKDIPPEIKQRIQLRLQVIRDVDEF